MDERTVLAVWPNQNPQRHVWTTSLQTPDGRSTMTRSVHSFREAVDRAEARGYELLITDEVYSELVAAGVAPPWPDVEPASYLALLESWDDEAPGH